MFLYDPTLLLSKQLHKTTTHQKKSISKQKVLHIKYKYDISKERHKNTEKNIISEKMKNRQIEVVYRLSHNVLKNGAKKVGF